MTRLTLLTLVYCFLSHTGIAQDKKTIQLKKASPGGSGVTRVHRTHYVAQNADPVILAEVVGKHFEGEAKLIPAPASGNAILVSGRPEVVADVVKLLEQMDRPARTVEVEIIFVDVPAPKEGKEEDLGGDLLARIETLAKDGSSQRIKLTVVEGQPVTTTTGGDKPIVSRSGPEGKGFGRSSSINYRPLGTTVRLSARVKSYDTVLLDLSLDDSQVRLADPADEPPSFDKSSLSTTVSVPARKAVLAQAIRTQGKTGVTTSAVIVTARVVDERPTSKPK